MSSKRINITLEQNVLKRLDQLAEDQGLSRSATIAWLVNNKCAYQKVK